MNSSLAQLPSAIPLDRSQLPRGPIEGLYVHVPFCFHKCHYCDFYSITRQDAGRMEKYVDLVLAEAALWSDWNAAPRTVFFGGGTPSLLPIEAMRRLIAGLRERFDLSHVAEWTVEANPATLSLEYCQMLRELGVDRISLGAQSFQPAELALLERHHVPADVIQSVTLAREAGFKRINLDLIYAIPGQDVASWSDSLEQVLALGTSHLSAYALTYEPNTPLAVRKRLGRVIASPDELEIQMMRLVRQRLTSAGLHPYEISNYALPGQACQHNLVYWTGGSYLGLGPSASSHLHGWRWRNPPHLGAWERAIEANEVPAIDAEHLSSLHRAGELAMLMLRLSVGIERATFHQKTGHDPVELFAPVVAQLAPAGLLEVDSESIRLAPAGLPVADAVAAEFLARALALNA